MTSYAKLQVSLPEVSEDYPSGDSYQGTVKLMRNSSSAALTTAAPNSTQTPNTLKHGTGKYGFADGSYYFGQWVDGQMEGKGVFYEASTGDKYDGVWEGGRRVQGVYRYSNGDMYVGGFDRETGTKKTGPSLVLDDCILYKALYREDRLIKRDLVLLPAHNSWEALLAGHNTTSNSGITTNRATGRSPSPVKRAGSPTNVATRQQQQPFGRNASVQHAAGGIAASPQYKAPRKVSTFSAQQSASQIGLSASFNRNDTKTRATTASAGAPSSPVKKSAPTVTIAVGPNLRTTERCESPTRLERFAALEHEVKASPSRAINSYYEDVGRDQQPADTPTGETETEASSHVNKSPRRRPPQVTLLEGETKVSSVAGDGDEGPLGADGIMTVVADAEDGTGAEQSGKQLTQQEALDTARAVLRQNREEIAAKRQVKQQEQQAKGNSASLFVRRTSATSPTRNSAFGSFHNSYASNASTGVSATTGQAAMDPENLQPKLNRNGSVVMPPPNSRSQTCRSLSGGAFGNLQRGVTEHVDDVSRKELENAFRYYNTSPRKR